MQTAKQYAANPMVTFGAGLLAGVVLVWAWHKIK